MQATSLWASAVTTLAASERSYIDRFLERAQKTGQQAPRVVPMDDDDLSLVSKVRADLDAATSRAREATRILEGGLSGEVSATVKEYGEEFTRMASRAAAALAAHGSGPVPFDVVCEAINTLRDSAGWARSVRDEIVRIPRGLTRDECRLLQAVARAVEGLRFVAVVNRHSKNALDAFGRRRFTGSRGTRDRTEVCGSLQIDNPECQTTALGPRSPGFYGSVAFVLKPEALRRADLYDRDAALSFSTHGLPWNKLLTVLARRLSSYGDAAGLEALDAAVRGDPDAPARIRAYLIDQLPKNYVEVRFPEVPLDAVDRISIDTAILATEIAKDGGPAEAELVAAARAASVRVHPDR